jgi:ABC-2 type transport system ATP-binding protein
MIPRFYLPRPSSEQSASTVRPASHPRGLLDSPSPPNDDAPVTTDRAIDLKGVSKTFRGRVRALTDVAVAVGRGEVFGLLGPNGAGKSTLVKIIMTVISPSRGAGTILGRPLGDRPTLARVGYLPENHRMPRYLTGRQTLSFLGALTGVPRKIAAQRAQEMLELVGMTAAADRRIGTYSKGMMQRIGLGQAMMNDPDLLVLDEPTDGVDPVGRRDIRQVISALRQRGKTVFINSHLLSELELICDRVTMLVRGQVVAQGTIEELSFAQQRYELEVDGDASPGAPPDLANLLPATWNATPPTTPQPAYAAQAGHATAVVQYGSMSDGTRIQLYGRLIRAATADAARVMPLLDAVRNAGLVVRRMHIVRPSLEELFIAAVHEPAPPGPADPAPEGRP